MDIEEAVEIITQERDAALPGRLRRAYDMAIITLDMAIIARQIQDGNLRLDSVDVSKLIQENSPNGCLP